MADSKAELRANMQREEARDTPFENILNFRDVGKTVNEFLGQKCGPEGGLSRTEGSIQGYRLTKCPRLIAEGKVFRSARPDDASLSDRKRLKEEFGIKTIIDLRTVTEHANQVKRRQEELKIPALVQSNAALAEPAQIPGISYLSININGKGFERSLLWQLSAWSIIKLVTLMIFGYRMQAISILGREVMQPRGLIGLGFDSIDHCGPEIADSLRVYSTVSNYPILIHCTQGKDRTGLIIALLLLLLSVPLPAISRDYCMSEAELESERESRLVEIRSIGLSEDFAGCPPDWIEKMEGHLNESYGGVREYCRSIGFSDTDEESLLSILSP